VACSRSNEGRGVIVKGSLAVILVFVVGVLPTWPADRDEVETLRQRIEVLEHRNAELTRQLGWVMEQLAHRVNAVESSSSDTEGAPHTTAAPSVAAQSPQEQRGEAPQGLLSALKQRVTLYGFLRLDAAYDSARSDQGGFIDWVLPKDDQRRTRGEFTLDPRMTRLGLRFNGSRWETIGAHVTGRFETDFYGSDFGQGNEKREKLRLRLAHLQITGPQWDVVAGQDWDLIAPLLPFPSEPNVLWFVGNLGDRRPQLRFSYHPRIAEGSRLFFQVALTRTIGRDLDGDGEDDGEASAFPTVQGRLALERSVTFSSTPFTLGIWSHYGEEFARTIPHGKHVFPTYSVGTDVLAPLSARLTFAGEVFWGENLDAVAGGIDQGINAERGKGIRAVGGWGEGQVVVNPAFSLAVGYGVDDPANRNLSVNGRSQNQVAYAASRFSLGGGVLLGMEYAYWRTDYKGVAGADLNRVHGYLQYEF
jgi:hypothetical protein